MTTLYKLTDADGKTNEKTINDDTRIKLYGLNLWMHHAYDTKR